MKKNKKIIIWSILILLIVTALYSFVKTNTNYVKLPSPEWKVYKNDKLGISFEYPQTWILWESENDYSWSLKLTDLEAGSPKENKPLVFFEIVSGCDSDYYSDKWILSNNPDYLQIWTKDTCTSNYMVIAKAPNSSTKVLVDKIISSLRFTSSAWKYSKVISIPYEARVRINSPKQSEKYVIGEKNIIEWSINRDASNFSIDLIDSETGNSVMSIASNELIRSSGIDGIFRYEWTIPNVDINKKYQIKISPVESRELLGKSNEFNIISPKIPSIPVLPSVKPGINNSFVSNYGIQGKCGLNLNYPIAGTPVKFPLVISGTVDNSNTEELGCSWNVFEGVIGTAQLYYNYNNLGWRPVGESFVVNSTGYSNGIFAITSTINFKNDGIGLSNNTPMKIVITEENPTEIPNSTDIFEMPVYLNN